MALVLMEGFDNMATGDMTAKGWSAAASSMQTGRWGFGQCARIGAATTITKVLPSTYSTIVAGFGWRNSTTAAKGTMFSLRSGATLTLQFQTDASNRILIKNSGGTTIATGTTPMLANTFYYIEIKLVVGASGTVEVRLNSVAEIASTVGNFGVVNIDTVGIVGVAAQTTDFDDIYLLDTTGSVNTSFLGDSQIWTLPPSGAGAHTQWTPLSGANYTNVDETTPDGDTTYNKDSNPGDIDTFTTAGIPSGVTVFGVQTNLYARKATTGLRQIADLIRQSSIDYVGSTDTLGSTYQFYTKIYNQDPTSTNWTAATVNADEFGYKLVT